MGTSRHQWVAFDRVEEGATYLHQCNMHFADVPSTRWPTTAVIGMAFDFYRHIGLVNKRLNLREHMFQHRHRITLQLSRTGIKKAGRGQLNIHFAGLRFHVKKLVKPAGTQRYL